eukprot:1160360-Pelagomonas_calceolata.AAC.6
MSSMLCSAKKSALEGVEVANLRAADDPVSDPFTDDERSPLTLLGCSVLEGTEVARLGGAQGGGASHLNTVHSMAWTWDDKCLASASADSTAKVCDCGQWCGVWTWDDKCLALTSADSSAKVPWHGRGMASAWRQHRLTAPPRCVIVDTDVCDCGRGTTSAWRQRRLTAPPRCVIVDKDVCDCERGTTSA